jgi:hypothetical protein
MPSAVLPPARLLPLRSSDSAPARARNKDPVLSHEIGKTLLTRAGTLLQRYEAIKTANRLGMPLSEIETYLDWLDSTQEQHHN